MTERKIKNLSTISFAGVNARKAPSRLDACQGAVLTIVPILSAVTVEGTGNDICTASVLHGRRQLHEQKKPDEESGITGQYNGRQGVPDKADTLLKAHLR